MSRRSTGPGILVHTTFNFSVPCPRLFLSSGCPFQCIPFSYFPPHLVSLACSKSFIACTSSALFCSVQGVTRHNSVLINQPCSHPHQLCLAGKPRFQTASKTGRRPCTPVSSHLYSKRSSGEDFLHHSDKVNGVPQVLRTATRTQIPHHVSPTHRNPSKSHAAFSTAMSEPQPENWEQFIDWSEHSYDWSKGDLLDACYDPMLDGMDQDR
ncbi:hypothetical protein BKA64DRAFT_411511 [Cadophora sp. MPI-SDFR-AT-0126]|nr:hypothetical protein BKA64DRAFT_411511 [Leotiomycetes sp. MPI-SDFR-AT-0126]